MPDVTLGVNAQDPAAPATITDSIPAPESVPASTEATAAQVTPEAAPGQEPPQQVSHAAQSETQTSPQTRADNAKFAALRRQAEAAEKRAAELEKQISANSALHRALESNFGVSGTPEEMADRLVASSRKISIDAARAERLAADQRRTEALKSDPEYKRATEQATMYRDLLIKQNMERDFSAVKQAHPEIKAANIEDLGDDFAALLGIGWDPVSAYEAIAAKQAKSIKTPPPSTGSVKSPEPARTKDYYTPEDVDKLTQADFDKDAHLLDKIEKSMARWK